ncbi:hypothetical protein ACFE04_011132 [Oxalis oulophora]
MSETFLGHRQYLLQTSSQAPHEASASLSWVASLGCMAFLHLNIFVQINICPLPCSWNQNKVADFTGADMFEKHFGTCSSVQMCGNLGHWTWSLVCKILRHAQRVQVSAMFRLPISTDTAGFQVARFVTIRVIGSATEIHYHHEIRLKT